jgi:hypothetical protein
MQFVAVACVQSLSEVRRTMNLAVLKKSRRKLAVGDVFVMQPPDGQYLWGRVILLDVNLSDVEAAILIYIYRTRTETKTPPPALLRGQLVIRPMLTNTRPWANGYFEHVEHRPLTVMERFPRHSFRDEHGHFFDEAGKRLGTPTEPFSALQIIDIDDLANAICLSLGIPLFPGEAAY